MKRPSPPSSGRLSPAGKQGWCGCVALGKSPCLSGPQPESCSWRSFQSSQVSTSNDLCTQALGGFQQTSCMCRKCHANSSGSGPHKVTYLSFPFPSSPATQRHMPAFSALHLVFLIPVQLRRPPSTPRQNSGPVTCWGPLDFQSPQNPTAASLFPAYLCTYLLSLQRNYRVQGMEGRAHLVYCYIS